MFCVKMLLCRGVDINNNIKKVNYVLRMNRVNQSSSTTVNCCSDLFLQMWGGCNSDQQRQSPGVVWWTNRWEHFVHFVFFCSCRGWAVVLILRVVLDSDQQGSAAEHSEDSRAAEVMNWSNTLNWLLNLHIWSLLVFFNPQCCCVVWDKVT